MNEYLLGLYEKAMPGDLSWKEKLETVKNSGFDYLEMSLDESDAKLARLQMTAAEKAEICQAVKETGIPVRSICLSGHRKYPLGSKDPEIRRRSLQIMEQAIALADALGVQMIQLAGYDVYYEAGDEETKRWFAVNLHAAVQMAARTGILLGFETMETPFMDTVAKAMHYVQAEQSPWLGVYPDAGNLTNASLLYGESLPADLQMGAGHLLAMHLKETVPGKYREIPFGQGHVDFSAAVNAAWALGIRRYVAELWYTGEPQWQDILRETSLYLRKYFPGDLATDN